MRFLELHLKAFGAFRDQRLVLPAADPGAGLVVVHGANESGKSTALRALRALLYGIPAQTPDAFAHAYGDLRVGARMRFADGSELGVMRRKKRSRADSLYRYEDDERVDDAQAARLEQLTEAVPQPLFERFYGIDHRQLSDGSAALLADDGEVGRALFGAGLGVANLRAVLDALDAEANALFLDRGRTQRIHQQLAEWKKLSQEIDGLSLDAGRWEALARDVQQAEAALAPLAEQIEQQRTERARLERLRRALPALARRAQATALRISLGDVPSLPPDFEERLREARAMRRAAEEKTRRAAARIERESEERDGIVLAPALIAEQERIEALHRQLASHEKTVDQLPRRREKLAELDAQIEDLLVRAGLPEADPAPRLRRVLADAGHVQNLAKEAARFEEGWRRTREEASEAERALAQLRGVASERPFDEPEIAAGRTRLKRALEQAGKLGGIDERIAEAVADARRTRDTLEAMRERLGLSHDAFERLERISFPDEALIREHQNRASEQLNRIEALREERQARRAEQRRIEEAHRNLAGNGELPDPERLEPLRRERDQAWQAVRRVALDPQASESGSQRAALADRFERRAGEADALVDRLRSEADRVGRRLSLEASGERLERELAELDEREEALRERGEALAREWWRAWPELDFELGTPERMIGWRRQLEEALGLIARQREADERLERERGVRDAALAVLRSAIVEAEGPDGASLAAPAARPGDAEPLLDVLVARAEALAEDLQERQTEARLRAQSLAVAEQRLAQASRRRREAEQARQDWRTEWSGVLGELGLPDDRGTGFVLERLEAMRTLFERLRERDELAARADQMQLAADRFEKEVDTLVERCASQRAGEFAATVVQRLQRQLGDALRSQSLYEKCVVALEEAREEQAEAQVALDAQRVELEALCQLAGVAAEEQIDPVLERWQQAAAARRARDDAEQELVNVAEGRPLEELEAESQGADPDVLGARIDTAAARIETLEQQQREAQTRVGELRAELARMDGSARVAELAERAESQLVGIRRDSERYVELRLAQALLETEIERYREQNQAPLLLRAGEHFAALTLGAYPRITSEAAPGAPGAPEGSGSRLLAVRASGTEVPVDGLSSGTRDQLFLALRLASLEQALTRGEPMPLIADDILIEFDDARACATLEVLARLASKTQILLFSHHRHIAEIARDLGGAASVVELPA